MWISRSKINFEEIGNLRRILKIPKQDLIYISYEKLSDIMKKSKKIITIHLYPFFMGRYKEKCLLDLNRWSYYQIYLCIYEDKIY